MLYVGKVLLTVAAGGLTIGLGLTINSIVQVRKNLKEMLVAKEKCNELMTAVDE